MHKSHNPPNVPKPGSYHHGVEVAPNARWLYISGQLGMTPDGKVLDGTAAQAEQAWMNIKNILAAAGMGVENLVKVTTFIINPADVGVVRAAREKVLGGVRAASTLLVIQALASPEYRIEIEAVAAKS
ncbi:MAG TPA: RidA family protein [Alphaproteobacteria bacterium]